MRQSSVSPTCLVLQKTSSAVSSAYALLDDVMQWLRRRRINVSKEVSGLTKSRSERVDVLVRCEGLVYWCDVSVAEPASASYLEQSCKKAGWAASKAEAAKTSKWKKFAPSGVRVQPLVMETSGRVGRAMGTFLKTMEKASASGATDTYSRSDLVMQLSVTCLRFNAQCVREAVDGEPVL